VSPAERDRATSVMWMGAMEEDMLLFS